MRKVHGLRVQQMLNEPLVRMEWVEWNLTLQRLGECRKALEQILQLSEPDEFSFGGQSRIYTIAKDALKW